MIGLKTTLIAKDASNAMITSVLIALITFLFPYLITM